MSKYILICWVVLEKLEFVIGVFVIFFDGFFVFVEQEDLFVIVVWLIDVQYIGFMIDEDDWQVIFYMVVFLRVQVFDIEFDIWMEEKIFFVLEEVSGLECFIDIMILLGYDYQCDSEMVMWGMVEIIYWIIYIN